MQVIEKIIEDNKNSTTTTKTRFYHQIGLRCKICRVQFLSVVANVNANNEGLS